MIEAEDCKNIEEIRIQIDKIDHDIIKLLSMRAKYVQYSENFKTDIQSVKKAEDRAKGMITKRKEWAKEYDMSPERIEKIYKTIVDCFVNAEMKKWNENTK